jgi:hypothetical protein
MAMTSHPNRAAMSTTSATVLDPSENVVCTCVSALSHTPRPSQGTALQQFARLGSRTAIRACQSRETHEDGHQAGRPCVRIIQVTPPDPRARESSE